MFTLMFWRATFERSIATAAQAGGAVVFVAVLNGQGLFDVNWAQVGSIAGLAFVAAVLKAMIAVGMGSDGPGFGGAETLTEKVAAVEAHPAAQAEYQAGPAAHVPEGTAVHVVPDVNYRESVEGAVNEALSADTKAQAAYHDPTPGDILDHESGAQDYEPRHGIMRHDK